MPRPAIEIEVFIFQSYEYYYFYSLETMFYSDISRITITIIMKHSRLISFTPGVNGWLPYHNYDSSNSFSNNNYTLEQWALMEASGAIFLPASGGRYGSRWWNDTKSYYADDNDIIVTVGYYWSVSHELTNNIFIVSENYYPQPSDIASRCWGVSVRPVLDNTI